jgi:type IV secretion system protein TrbB
MEQLIQEAVVTVPRAMIAETIQFIAVRVEGLGSDGDYVLHAAGDRP